MEASNIWTSRVLLLVAWLAGCADDSAALLPPTADQVTSELRVGLRRMKQHYRFKLVALAAAQGQSLTTAAHAAGFADSGHFSRTFLETFGLSPSKVLLRT